MNIGIDLSPLQGPHRMRGIGSVAVNFINNLSKEAKADNKFVFFVHADSAGAADPFENLNLSDMDYSTRLINAPLTEEPIDSGSNRSNRLVRGFGKLRTKISRRSLLAEDGFNPDELDSYIQFDPTVPLINLPKGTKKHLMVHDLIPYVLEYDYLWSYKTTRKRGNTRRSALKHAYHRWLYIHVISANTKHADTVFADSEHTKRDLVRFAGTPTDKIEVVLLGVNKPSESSAAPTSYVRYVETSWGPIPRASELPSKPYLLFSGGVDPRRKIVDLFAAYNNLKARGEDIALVLVGDTMNGLSNIPNADVQHYLAENTSYLEDIYCLGFVNQTELDYLYRNALAFVYPSVYEGFGLPVLEAMRYNTPVITYPNSSLKEVGGEVALYAKNYSEIVRHVMNLTSNEAYASKVGFGSSSHANNFTWRNTVVQLLKLVKGV